MKLTLQAKLVVTGEQEGALRETMRQANACCDRLSAWAWENKTFGKYPLQKARYPQERTESGLTSQAVIRCISKTADAYRLDKKTRRTFQPLGAIAYNDRILTWYIRALKKMSRRASRFCKHVNHVISKRLAQLAASSRKAFALEDLTGIHERANGFSGELRWQLGNWPFHQLGQFIAYKARLAGVPVVSVDSRDTSKTCSYCGYCDRANRKSQSSFLCQQCGFQINADVNASRNIARKGLEAWGQVSGPKVATA